mmetsp:Transcript_7255/g.22158  ORF Transcript_7255/g.22158 Transcript_7255/m.22158 type:complete len:80 (-) Transcript_7255:67-306(-)
MPLALAEAEDPASAPATPVRRDGRPLRRSRSADTSIGVHADLEQTWHRLCRVRWAGHHFPKAQPAETGIGTAVGLEQTC